MKQLTALLMIIILLGCKQTKDSEKLSIEMDKIVSIVDNKINQDRERQIKDSIDKINMLNEIKLLKLNINSKDSLLLNLSRNNLELIKHLENSNNLIKENQLTWGRLREYYIRKLEPRMTDWPNDTGNELTIKVIKLDRELETLLKTSELIISNTKNLSENIQ